MPTRFSYSALAVVCVLALVDNVAALTVRSFDRSSSASSAYGPFEWMRDKIFHHSKPEEKSPAVVPSVRDVAKVEIYYETKCPACEKLLNGSLRQAFEDKNLSARIEFNLYPFGNAVMLSANEVSKGYHFWHDNTLLDGARSLGTLVGDVVFVCQHGDQECLGNMIQACTMDVVKTPSRYVPFTLCMASYNISFGVEKTSYECGDKLGIDMNAVRNCVLSRTGTKLQSNIGKVSNDLALNRDHVPFVMINGVNFPDAEDGELITSICTSLTDPKPSICQEKTGTGSSAVGCGHGLC
jgi:interferon gamma-inducible protein 30|mmetsp:Transcript_15699/g.25524  ORF Transcript_15699/g.25524 Transcript_15699/m.25524 type:complete len:296 (-) Transcript_15699:117-1004(-)